MKEGVLLRAWIEPATGDARWPVAVPRALMESVLKASHGTTGAGHFGISKTLRRLRQSFYWGKLRRDVEDFCHRWGPPDRSHAQLQQLAVGAPMERVAVDIIGPIPSHRQRQLVCSGRHGLF